ncbi:MAG: alkyl sulfatase C-terminal domain-containing protein, partial [Rhizomicrobium sp.]
GMSVDVLTATTTPMLLDFAAVRVNPKKASERAFKINVELTDRNERHLLTVENGVLIHEAGVSDAKAGATVRLKRPELLMTLLAGMPAAPRIASGDIAVKGDASLYAALTGLIEPIVANFPIVTP